MPTSPTSAATPASPAGVPHEQLANAIRVLAMDAVEAAKSGHPGMPMGMADVATVLFGKFLKFDPKVPMWPDRDRFVLSAGHGSMLLYSLLHLTGYEEMTIDELKRFRQLGSKTPGHPEVLQSGGIETTTGPLGQGISTAVGMALAERILNARFGDDLVDHYTYVIASDGDLMEGISHEAASFAGHLGLSKLIVLWDDNQISIDGPTSLSFTDDTLNRFRAYGWDVREIDGHNPQQIHTAIEYARTTDAPSLIACKTIIGYGAPTKGGTHHCHGSPLGADEIKAAREKLAWTHEHFIIPEEITSVWRGFGQRGVAERESWEARLNAAGDTARTSFNNAFSGDMPPDFDALIDGFKAKISAEKPKLATRVASGNVLDVLVPAVPELIGGSADLTPSNNTKVKNTGAVQRDNFNGRYVHFGVREHGMAAAMNGMALHGGIIPYGGTFMTFSDYCRPAIRLAALMKCRTIFIMTHDSIGLGEDGPTHQPVEHVPALRTIPNLLVFRPADAVETAECWAIALKSKHRPSVFALTRQNLATVRTEHTTENLSAKGGYVLAAAEGERKVTIFATGSEVEIAVEARKALQAEGIGTTVVSMPSWELFEEQDEAYQEEVIGENTVRIAVEAQIRQGWDRYVGRKGAFIGMKSFGESAPYQDLYKHFGITADAVVAAAKARL
ncbi:transketolase [Skermanella aerolata]|uniref:Transketolase n=1 Tax=Skermanella aerolata TaxID=393310 RepID=A0A512DRU9_9PROT|nr:transketolase [Skermanella aerolata]GEO39211.1 transketolase [Skermanella aerolata]